MKWDCIIIGGGLSGCAAAHQLTKKGFKVLLIEKGRTKKEWPLYRCVDYAEAFLTSPQSRTERLAIYPECGRNTLRVNNWIPVLGQGEGGSSAVYGSVLLRLPSHEWEGWPLTSKDVEPYYQRAETLLSPRGTPDPLEDDHRLLLEPDPLSDSGRELFDFFKERGYHPFQTPIGYQSIKDCGSCFGHLCRQDCKKNGSTFLDLARRTGLLTTVFSTEVHFLQTRGSQVHSVLCSGPGGPTEYRADAFLLTAGALSSPALLLRSRSSQFPMGLGNNFDLVGRYLMRHFIDFYFVKTHSSSSARGHRNEMSFTDFCYDFESDHIGLISSVPSLMPVEYMAREFLLRLQAQSPFPLPFSLLTPLLKSILHSQTNEKVLVTHIFEDSPHHFNQVQFHDAKSLSLDELTVSYKISPKDKKRIRRSRQDLMALLKPLSPFLLKVAEDSSFLAHVCGTCRMGVSPETGVTDKNGKLFGIKNAWIGDASIFSRSGSVNPGLTVAALALRVADHIAISHRSRGDQTDRQQK